MRKKQRKLPNGWRMASLADEELLSLIMGQSPPGDTYNNERIGLPFFQGKADFGHIYPQPSVWCSSPTRIAEPNDILLSVRAPVGPTNIAKEQCCIGRGIAALRCKKKLYYKYIFFFLRNFERIITSEGSGSTFDAIGKDQIKSIYFPLPPTLDEQKAIAQRLELKMAEVEKMRQAALRQKEAAEDLKGKILTKAFPFKNGDKLPEGWKWAKCQDIIDVRDGTHDTPAYIEKGIPLVTSKNLKNGQIDFETAKFISTDDHKVIEQRSKVDDGDILFAMIGTIGNPVIVKKDRDFSIKNIALFKFKNSPISTKFFYHLLSSQIINDQLSKITQGGIQSFVSLQFLREISIPVPYSSVVQNQISEKLDRKMKEIEKVAQAVGIQLEAIQALPAAILREVFDFQEANA